MVSIRNNSTLLLRSHLLVSLEKIVFKNPLSSAVMAVQLRPGKSNLLKVSGYNFTMEDVEEIYTLYSINNLTLWEIKERRFREADIKQLAVAVHHGLADQENIPYSQRPGFTYDPEEIDLTDFKVGIPSHLKGHRK